MLKNYSASATDSKKAGNATQQKTPESPKTPAEELTGVETDSNLLNSVSISEIPATSPESRSLIWKILREHLKFHPYRFKFVQDLPP